MKKQWIVLLTASLLTQQAVAFSQRLPQSAPAPSSTPPKPPAAAAPVTPSDPTVFKALWETKRSEGAQWSAIVRRVVGDSAPGLMKGPQDVESFCPMYRRLGSIDQLNFWVQFFAAVAQYESGFDPTSRMTETTMGADPVTGQQVVSEGLLQLSYQDELWWPFCDFDYSADRRYGVKDVRRSILDPEKNLSCGIQILNRQVEKRGAIALSSNVYWAVLKINGKYTKLPEIRSITKKLPFCQ